GTIGAPGDPGGPGCSCPCAAGGAYQLMPLRLGHHRLDRGQRNALVTPRRAILSPYGRLAGCTLLCLDHYHLIDVLHREQRGRLARGTRVSTATAMTPRATWPAGLGRVARRGA